MNSVTHSDSLPDAPTLIVDAPDDYLAKMGGRLKKLRALLDEQDRLPPRAKLWDLRYGTLFGF